MRKFIYFVTDSEECSSAHSSHFVHILWRMLARQTTINRHLSFQAHNFSQHPVKTAKYKCFLESTFDANVDCKATDDQTSGCKTSSGQEGWQCNNGECIEKERVCDNSLDCLDSSDEDIGCGLYPGSTCNSWFGLNHVECVVEGNFI